MVWQRSRKILFLCELLLWIWKPLAFICPRHWRAVLRGLNLACKFHFEGRREHAKYFFTCIFWTSFLLKSCNGKCSSTANQSEFWERHAVSREEVSRDPGRGCRAETVLSTLQAFCRHEVNRLDVWRHSALRLKETALSMFPFKFQLKWLLFTWSFFLREKNALVTFCSAVFHSPPVCALQNTTSFISEILSLSTQMCKSLSLGFFGVVRLVWFGGF